VARDFFDALRDARWADAAARVHPDATAALRESRLALLIAWAEHRDEIRAARAREGMFFGYSSDGIVDSTRLARHAATPLPAFDGCPTLGALAELEPAAFMATLLSASNGPVGATTAGPLARPSRRVIGEVYEGERLAHVLYRAEGGGIAYTDPHHVDVVHLTRVDEDWREDWRVALTTMNDDLIDGGYMLRLYGADELEGA
jgi:hypothetical protein